MAKNFSEALNFFDFKYVFGFSISFFDQKLQPFKVGPSCLFLPVLSVFVRFWPFLPTLEGCKYFLASGLKWSS